MPANTPACSTCAPQTPPVALSPRPSTTGWLHCWRQLPQQRQRTRHCWTPAFLRVRVVERRLTLGRCCWCCCTVGCDWLTPGRPSALLASHLPATGGRECPCSSRMLPAASGLILQAHQPCPHCLCLQTGGRERSCSSGSCASERCGTAWRNWRRRWRQRPGARKWSSRSIWTGWPTSSRVAGDAIPALWL